MSYFEALIIAIVEGLTEFLPISSTAHMIFAAQLLGVDEKDLFTKLFVESIQFGAIISVIVLYYKTFFDFKKISFYLKLGVAFIPAAIAGILLKSHIDAMLESPLVIAGVMLGGGILLIFIDNFFKNPTIIKIDEVGYKKSFIIGVFQIVAVVLPGFSRSAATILGGLQQKLDRKTAAEFSFFLAVPTLAGAFAKSIWDVYSDNPEVLTNHNIGLIAFGNLIAFLTALAAVKTFITFLTRHGFKGFGYYRIAAGLILIILILSGIELSVI